MQGINKAKHAHLMDALLGLEKLLSRQLSDDRCMQEIVAHRDQLQAIFGDYDHLLSELAILITDYEVLYNQVKVQFLAKKLKEIKKEMAVEKPSFAMLRSSIRLVYFTQYIPAFTRQSSRLICCRR